jgi:hypothetical protein
VSKFQLEPSEVGGERVMLSSLFFQLGEMQLPFLALSVASRPQLYTRYIAQQCEIPSPHHPLAVHKLSHHLRSAPSPPPTLNQHVLRQRRQQPQPPQQQSQNAHLPFRRVCCVLPPSKGTDDDEGEELRGWVLSLAMKNRCTDVL